MKSLFLDTMTLKGTPVRDKLAIAAKIGFSGVRIRGNDVKEFGADGSSPTQLRALMQDLHLVSRAYVTESEVYDWHLLDPSLTANAARMRAAIQTGVAIGADCGLFPVMQAEGSIDQLLTNFNWLCDLGAEQDFRIGLEFIGHVPKMADLATAWEVVSKADHPYGGLVIDMFHFYRGGSRLADLSRIPGNRIFVVDIDDAMDLPRQELLGYKHRVYPGQGVAPVADIVRRLCEQGFDGPYCVELFNEAYWSADPLAVAREAFDSASAILREAGAA